MKLSLCMIVKNEGAVLGQCLESVRGLVDEVIIVDTGSSDKTREIAQHFVGEVGGSVVDFTWVDDFSAARNESLKHATGDWILVLDADEVIAQQDHAKIKQAIKKASEKSDKSDKTGAKVQGFYLKTRNYLPREQGFDFTSSKGDHYAETKNYPGWKDLPVIRLFRNQHRYAGIIHESVEPSIFKLRELPEYKHTSVSDLIEHLDVPVHHYGFVLGDEHQQREKAEAYFRMGEKKIRETPSAKAYLEQGRRYLELQEYRQALHCFQTALVHDPQATYVFPDLIFCCGKLLMYEDADLYFEQAMTFRKNDLNALMAYGLVNIQRRTFDRAINCFSKLLQAAPKRALAYYALAVSFYELGNLLESYKQLTKCVQLNPHFVDAHDLLAKLLIANKKYDKAYVVLRKVIELDDDRPDAYFNLALVCKRLGRQDQFEDYRARALQLGVNDKMKAALFKS